MQIDEILQKQPILLFDGECGFCNKSVAFFLKREKNSAMYFAPIASETGIELLKYFELDPKIDSMVLIRNRQAYIRSCAALRLTWYMKGAWPLLSVFLIIPPFLRHPVYNFIAWHRMKLFGRVESCALVPPEKRNRLIGI
jgi:predicted DCC family thiol-disulfide oxidoreductase YuxK